MNNQELLEWQEQLDLFFSNLEHLIRIKIEKETYREAQYKLAALSAGCFTQIRNSHLSKGIVGLIAETESNEIEVTRLLKLELEYFNLKYGNDNLNEYSVDEGIENGETVKGSLEDFFKLKLPNWAKKTLKILNEILGIVKTIV